MIPTQPVPPELDEAQREEARRQAGSSGLDGAADAAEVVRRRDRSRRERHVRRRREGGWCRRRCRGRGARRDGRRWRRPRSRSSAESSAPLTGSDSDRRFAEDPATRRRPRPSRSVPASDPPGSAPSPRSHRAGRGASPRPARAPSARRARWPARRAPRPAATARAIVARQRLAPAPRCAARASPRPTSPGSAPRAAFCAASS